MMDSKNANVEASTTQPVSHSYPTPAVTPRPASYSYESTSNNYYRGDESADWQTSNDLAEAMWG